MAAAAVTSLGGLKFVKNGSYSVSKKEKHHAETGSPFDATRITGSSAVREHDGYAHLPVDGSAFSAGIITVKRDPKKDRLRAGTGVGGTLRKTATAGPRRAPPPDVSGRKLKASSKRRNPPNTYFRRLFERGDIPIKVNHTPAGIRVAWLKPIDKLDMHHFLPIFMSGVRETEEPYASLALYGAQDLLGASGDRILPTVPQLIQPLREALVIRDTEIIRRVLLILQKLVTCGDLVGEALVPFYRQLLPVLNVFKSKHHNLGDKIDYGQRFQRNIGELIQATLEMLEVHGGPDAFINLRYCIPTYESVVYTV